ncbi:unnamed protein product [Ilex paraguariensis]|uniref:PPIase cyclophilin-type domain-containing protein n=1 Tax=Ilex paraguariensis TaxID=185542 RepID=A0ABC8SZC0_9AQUA
MASIAPQTFLSLSKPIKDPNPKPSLPHLKTIKPTYQSQILLRTKRKDLVVVGSVAEELDVIPVQSSDCTDQQDGVVSGIEREVEGGGGRVNQVVGGFGNEGMLSFEGAGFSSSASSSVGGNSEEESMEKWIDRSINATIVLAASTFAITKLLTIDQDYWHVVIDGYSAPLTAGNFAKLVVDGAYNGVKLSCTDQAILSDSGFGKNSGYGVPLEIMPSGQFEPLYKTTLSVQDGELPVLPLSVYGAVAMAHSDVSEEYSSPYQFFFYLYDKRNSGLGGLSFEEGQFSVFGYTTVGRDILPQIKTGDVIQSAKLVEGQDRLILPDEN